MATKAPISRKQEAFLRAEDTRINLLSGSVRSGKTWISLLQWAIFVGSMPSNYEFIMCGKTVTALKRNCLNLLVELVGDNFKYSLSQKSGMLFGHRIWLEGANDERSEGKIRGLTLGGAYCDELTLFPQGFYMMLLSRLSLAGARLYATTNPDAPTHWVKRDIIDNEQIQEQFSNWHFTLDDNDFNDPEYVENLKREYSGVFYQRYILGEWVLAEGLIYPNYKDAVVPTEERKYSEYQISCDYGIQNPFAMGLYGLCDGVYYKVKEYHHSGRETNKQKTDNDYYDDLVTFAGELPIRQVIIDPSAASFIALIRSKGRFNTKKANNEVLAGINCMATAMQQGLYKINDCCVKSIEELGIYAWDSDSEEDKPIKESDHHCITGDTMVNTVDGDIPIKELVDKCGLVWCYDEQSRRKTVAAYSNVRLTQKQAEIFEVELKDGKIIRATADHPILTESGWKPLKDLTTGDKILNIGK